ncbi:hypothetical protein ACQBAR_09250 [Propionibacteriaceae bacterium Y1685]|uniref:hypothetical protein n=1 Tax=Microlunatus sp. Y1700 TaxID=3418487 RepID=UPI003B7E735B
MSNFTVQESELVSAGSRVAPVADELGGITVTVPDPQMYGTLVGASATDAEPFTTTQLNALITAEEGLLASIARRLVDSARQYGQCEEDNIARIATFTGDLA